MDNINWALVTGVIGAAAWIPPVVSVIRSFFKRPLVTVIPSHYVTVGFTELGPVLNIKVAITSNQDVLINNVQLNVKHESGANFLFRWHEVVEVKGQMIFPGAANQPVFQETEAIAMKILPSDFKDVELRNRSATHTETCRKLWRDWTVDRRRQMNLGEYDSAVFFASRAVQDMVAYLRSQMVWRSGRYSVQIEMDSKTPSTFDVPALEFELSEYDIVLMQENCDNMSKYMRNACLHDSARQEEFEQLSWHWLPQTVRRCS